MAPGDAPPARSTHPLLAGAMEEARLRGGAWVAGAVELLDAAAPRVAVIGSRGASAEALALAEAVGSELARHGAIVVSGAADGIDHAAHLGALRAGGATIAVGIAGMGVRRHGVDRPDLEEAATRWGGRLLAISPFPLHQAPTRSTPVLRNRLIAALAEALLVGEAGPESGTMHCLRAALELRRPAVLLEAPDAGAALGTLHRTLRQQGVRLVPAAAWADGRAVAMALRAAQAHRLAAARAAEAQLRLLPEE